MNKTKYALIITCIVLNFCSAAANIYFAVVYFMNAYQTIAIFLGLYEALGAVAYGITSGLLIYAIAGKGRHFRARNSYYMTAVVLTLCLNLFSIPSILLVITLFMSDWVWVKPIDDVYFEKEEKKEQPKEEVLTDKEKEEKIAALRKLRDDGKITQEEFSEQLFKLL